MPVTNIIGDVTRTPESFQGHHLPNDKPRVLAIFDEASAIGDEFYEASQSWAHRMLVVGNPLSTKNFFYRCSKAGDVDDPAGGDGLLRRVIHIDGLRSPNVQLGRRLQEEGRAGTPPVLISGLLTYAEYLRRERQWDEVKKTTRLHGHFYEGEHALLFPWKWLDAAGNERRWAELYGALRKYLNPDREEGIFALPPCSHKLRHELGVLPLQYDSEGRMFLPPKDHNTAGPHQGPSLRQLLGRSPDRADSLVLAVWQLKRWMANNDFSNRVLFYDGDGELTPEEIAAMPDEFRELCEIHDEFNREN